MRFTEFATLSEDHRLTENKQQYKQIIDTVVKAGAMEAEKANDLLREVRLLLQRSDRITWWLLNYRERIMGYYVSRQKERLGDEVDDPYESEAQQKEYEDLFKRVTKKPWQGFSTSGMLDFNREFGLDTLRNHWSPMFDQAEPVAEVRWDVDLSIEELANRLVQAEEQWRKANEQEVEMQGDDQIIIDYGDKAWVMLDRPACESEGRAMGHCGNRGDYDDDDRIFSFRSRRPNGKQKPHLTFIRDGEGYLGEMKGRANAKPAKKYHRYIVDLLKSEYVDGIKGGGYMPETNFSLRDLPEASREEIIESKPKMGSAYTMIGAKVSQSAIVEKLTKEMQSLEIPYKKITASDVLFSMESDITEVIGVETLSTENQLKTASEIYSGQGSIEDIREIPQDEIYTMMGELGEDLWDSLSKEDVLTVKNWVLKHYDEVEKDSPLMDIIEEVDEIETAMAQAIRVGLLKGAENSVTREFESWLDDEGIKIDSTTGKFVLGFGINFVAQELHEVLQNGRDNENFMSELFDREEFDLPDGTDFDMDEAIDEFAEALIQQGILK